MAQNINQFKQTPVQGQLDLATEPNTVSAMVDAAQDSASPLIAGQAVTVVNSAGGVPKVIAAAADQDDIFGFVNYDIKSPNFGPGDYLELSFLAGNIMWMTAGAAIDRYGEVMIVPADKTVVPATSTNRIIGRAFDKAANIGDLIRVVVILPGAIKA